MTKTISRVEFAAMMSEAAMKFPASKGKGDEAKDERFNRWLRASDTLASVGEPFSTYDIPDATREDGYREVPLRKITDMPRELLLTVRDAMIELQVAKIR